MSVEAWVGLVVLAAANVIALTRAFGKLSERLSVIESKLSNGLEAKIEKISSKQAVHEGMLIAVNERCKQHFKAMGD